jgi:hypothetical protein
VQKAPRARPEKAWGSAPGQVVFLPCRSAEGATPDIGSRSIVNEPLLFILLRIFNARMFCATLFPLNSKL